MAVTSAQEQIMDTFLASANALPSKRTLAFKGRIELSDLTHDSGKLKRGNTSVWKGRMRLIRQGSRQTKLYSVYGNGFSVGFEATGFESGSRVSEDEHCISALLYDENEAKREIRFYPTSYI